MSQSIRRTRADRSLIITPSPEGVYLQGDLQDQPESAENGEYQCEKLGGILKTRQPYWRGYRDRRDGIGHGIGNGMVAHAIELLGDKRRRAQSCAADLIFYRGNRRIGGGAYPVLAGI
jgi:hypothetical protein